MVLSPRTSTWSARGKVSAQLTEELVGHRALAFEVLAAVPSFCQDCGEPLPGLSVAVAAIGVGVGVLVAMTLFARRVAHLTETARELVEDDHGAKVVYRVTGELPSH
ncbi:hypothetical protein [Marmoricola sp. RAF53]|uniref:hypothetical protein n=1 Tax=Marmoricola sp. RAF53 TaxID=3233059 RepID=UPI003F98BE88